MTISDTASVDSISSDLIKVEALLPVTLVMTGMGQLMECRAETVPLCYLAPVLMAGAILSYAEGGNGVGPSGVELLSRPLSASEQRADLGGSCFVLECESLSLWVIR